MESGQSLARSTRLTQIQHFLYENPRGLNSGELAKLCGVCIRTIQRDLQSLQSDLGIPLTQDGDRYGIMDGYILPPVSFSLYEAVALFLASRLVFRQTDESNTHVQAALSKMSNVLPPVMADCVRETSREIGEKPSVPNSVRIFESVALAWTAQRRLKIRYHSLQSVAEKEWLLDPYFLEMTGVGYSIYVIGRARRAAKDEITTFKLDRISEAELLDESFEVPDRLKLERLISSSWGVMRGEETDVKLKFSPRVTRRVKESNWHPTQVIEDLPDGGCMLTVRVGSTLEMTPWIRGWGPDVEVLSPPKLRAEMIQAAERLLNTYRSPTPVPQAR